MKAIRIATATAALVVSISAAGAGEMARQLHQSDGYNPSDLPRAVMHQEGSADTAWTKALRGSDGTVTYGFNNAKPREHRSGMPDAELTRQLRQTDGAGS